MKLLSEKLTELQPTEIFAPQIMYSDRYFLVAISCITGEKNDSENAEKFKVCYRYSGDFCESLELDDVESCSPIAISSFGANLEEAIAIWVEKV